MKSRKVQSTDHKNAIASLDVDTQNGFTPLCPDELPIAQGHQIVDQLNAQATFAKVRIGSKDAHPSSAVWTATKEHPPFSALAGKNVDVYWPVHCVPGTKGFELVQGLPHPTDYDFFVWKGIEPDMHPYGACYHDLANKLSTGLIEYLKIHNITTIIVGGLATDFCVKYTVLQLLEQKFTVIVNRAACRGIDAESSKAAWQVMAKTGAILVNSANAIPEILKNLYASDS